MGFKLVKLNKDKVETPEPPPATEPSIEEPGQGITGEGSIVDTTALAQVKEVARRTKDVVIRDVTASQLRNDGNEDGGITFYRSNQLVLTERMDKRTRRTPWGIPIPEGRDAADPVFRRHPLECSCFRAGILRCGVPCVWAWPPEAKAGDKALALTEGNR